MAVAFMPGYDQSLNTLDNPTEMDNLRRFAKDFVKHYQTEKLTVQLEEQEKRQKSIESNYKKNQREHKKLNKSLDKIAKKMNSDKTDEAEKFKLGNEKIADEARIMAPRRDHGQPRSGDQRGGTIYSGFSGKDRRIRIIVCRTRGTARRNAHAPGQ